MGERRGQIDHAGALIDRGRLQGGDLVLPQCLAHDVEPAREWCIAEAALALPWPAGAVVAVSDFSGLMSSAWALAKAEASAATVSLDRGMGRLHFQHIKAH